MAAKRPFVSIIIPHFNNKKLIKKCLDSLSKTDYPKAKLEVIVVDNASTDDSVKFVKSKYKKVKVIANKQNNYCQACNLGILKAKGKYVVLLNNDVTVKKDWLLELVKIIEKDDSIGGVTSMLLEKKGIIQNAGLYELPNFYWDERGAGKKPNEYDSVEDIDAVSGACVLYRKTALKDAGLFDEDFVIFGEDVDMSMRLKKKGIRLVCAPSSIAYHKKHGSCNEEFAREAIEKNRLLLIAKHYPDKLAKSLIGNGYFISKNTNRKSGRFYDLLPYVFLKLIKGHGQAISGEIIKEVFFELGKITNYETKKIEEDVKNILADLIGTRKDRDYHKSQSEKYRKDADQKEKAIVDKNKRMEDMSLRLKDIQDEILSYKKEIPALYERIKDKDNIIAERNNCVGELSSKLNSLQDELRIHKDEISNIANKLKESLGQGVLKDNTIQEKIRIIEDNNRHIQELSNQLKHMNNELQARKDEISNIANKLKISLYEVVSKDKTIKEKDDIIQRDSKNIEGLSAQITFLQKETQSQNEKITDLVNKLRINLDEISSRDNVIKDKDSIIAERNNCVGELSSKLSSLQDELRIHKDEINNIANRLRSSLDDAASKDRIIQEKGNIIDQNNRHIEDLSKQLSFLHSELKHHQEEISNLSSKLSVSLDSILARDAIIFENNSQMDNLTKQLNDIQKELEAYKEESLNLANMLKVSLDSGLIKDNTILKKDHSIEELSHQLSSLKDELQFHKEEITNLSDKLSGALDNILSKDNTILENNFRIESLSIQLNSLQNELQAYKEEVSNLTDKLKISLDDSVSKSNIIFENNKHIENLSIQLNSLQNELQAYKEEVSNLTDKLKISLDDGVSKDNIIIENNRNIENLSKQLNFLQDELQSYKEETTILNNKLKESLDNSLLKDNTIFENNSRIENLSIQLNSFQNELQAYKEEVSNLTDKLKISLDDGVSRDNIIIEKSQQLENTANRLNETQKELNGIYSSEGFRFVLNPLWKIIWYSRIWLKKVIAKSSEFVWSFVVLLLSPVFLAQVVFFALERVSELLFGNILRYFKKKREVVPFDKLTVSVVIPNWNGLELLRKCLSSLCETDDFKQGKYEILVVDDASRQSIADAIKDDFPGVRVIRNRYNQGFGKTCNRGVKEAKGELIVLLNNDIMVSKEFLEPLKAHFKDSEVFAVSPKLYYWDMKSFNYGMHMGKFKDGYLSLWNEAETGYGDKISQASPTVFAVGGAMCFRRKDFLWLGGFDEIYRPNCWEDIDISYRAQKRGLKVLYEPSSLMYHKGAATLNYIRYKEIKNELLFMWKNISDSDMFLSHINHLPKFLYYGRHSSRITFLRGYLWAFNLLVSALVNRFKESGYVKLTDKKVLDRSMLYYRNFMRNGFAHRERKTILLITPFIIYPLNSGGKLRMYNLYRRLSEKYNIILLSLIHDEKEADYANSDSLKRVFKEIHVVHQKTPSNEFLFPERYKYSFSNFFIEKLKEIQETTPIDLIHIESNELLYLTRHVKHIPVVYTEHDISILSPHKSYYKKHITDIVLDFADYLKIVRHHDYFYKKIDKVIALSKQDIKVVNAFAPKSDCSLVATGVDLERFKFQDKTGKNKSLIFVGHYPHYPNEEAAVYFCQNIFPVIKKSMPDVTLKLVGSDPTENIKRLSNIEGVEVTGTVQDVRPYFQNASVFVCPFQTSAGIKGKVLEAMATGTPVVCTTRGSYGIDGKNGFSILIEDRPEDFANRVIELLQDDELYRKISRHARLLVEEKYDWNKIAQKLDGIYTDIMGRGMVINKVPDAGLNPLDMDMRQAPSNNAVRDIIRKTDDVIRLSLEYLDKEGMRDINLNPEELHIELTHMCNSRCITCDIWDYHKRNNKSVKDEISLNEIKDFISNSKRLKDIKTVVLSGGEAFLRPDFVDICFAIKELLPQASLGILSNGVNSEIVSSKTKEILKKISPESIWIGSSLDGLGEIYDRVRGVSGGFDGFIRTLEFFKKELPGIRFSATFVLTPFNIDQLVPCWEFADKNNIDFFAQFGVPKEARSEDVFQWSGDDLLKIEGYVNRIIERMIKKASNLEDFDKSLITAHDKINLLTKIYYWSHLVDYQKTQRRFAYNCDAAFKFAMLDPYGNMFFCPLLKHKAIGNVRGNNVDDIWASREADEVRDFIGSGKCSCWLVCTVFPIVGKALSLYGDKAARDISIGGKINILWQDIDVKHNHELNEEEFGRRKIVLESVPQGVTIGANYRCNANCAFCLGGNYKPFNLKLYKNYFEPRIGSMIKEADYVSFCGMGELLLVPDIKDFLKYVNVTLPDNNKILTTNGLALKNNLADIFIDSKYSIQISLHASNARLHEQITGLKGGFDKIIEQMRFIIARRKNAQSPYVTLVFVANTMNIEDLPNFVELAGSLAVDSVQVNYMTIFKTSHLKLSCFFMQEKANEIFDRAMRRANELKINLSLPPRFSADRYFKSICSDPWKNIYVDTEGAVLPCCYSGEHFGELRKNDVSSIWNNVKYQHIRTDLSSGNALAMCKYCLNSNPANVNLLNAHVSFRPEVQKLILNN